MNELRAAGAAPATPGWTPAYVGLGSNLDDPLRQVQTAMERLGSLPRSRRVACSRLYRSHPLGPQDQPQFINGAAAVLTQLTPQELLAALKAIERDMGRAAPPVRWGPRRIDLDLLMYGELALTTEALTLPHPGLSTRNFVLCPLAEIAPDLRVPGHGAVRDLAERAGNDGLWVLP